MRTLACLFVLAILVLPGEAITACCMVPRDFMGDVDQNGQQIVVMHHEGHQELVARVAPFFQGSNEGPDYLAWVLTVPSKPTAYATADRHVFTQAQSLQQRLDDLAARQLKQQSHFYNPMPGMTVDSAAKGLADNTTGSGLSVSEPIVVGPYEITEVKAQGVDALTELNRYLEARAFPQEDPAHMRWFVENNFTFLCIYIRPPEGQTKLGERLDLDPLQVGFGTPRPYYPGMFSSQQGNFALRLTTVTSKPLERRGFRAIKDKLNAWGSEYTNLWTETELPTQLHATSERTASFAGVKRWYVNNLNSRGFNRPTPEPAISKWKEDVRFNLGGGADEPPDWYYGDRPISSIEQLWREHKFGILIWTVLVCLLFLAFRSYRRRSRTVRKRAA